MMTQYDMASCQVILEPESEAVEVVTAAPPPVELRLQTVAEAVALEKLEKPLSPGMPADLAMIDPACFVAAQD